MHFKETHFQWIKNVCVVSAVFLNQPLKHFSLETPYVM